MTTGHEQPLQPKRDFVCGTDTWPGLAKLMEECGELMQVIGKIIAFPAGSHPDGGMHLLDRFVEESADVQAALVFVHAANGIKHDANREDRKIDLFHTWHEEALHCV